MKLTLLFVIMAVVALFLPGCTFLVNKLAFFPTKRAADESIPLPAGMREVTIRTADGAALRSLLFTIDSAKKAIIYFHGNAGDIYDRIPELLRFAKSGCTVLGVSYRGYGKSSGRPSERGIYKDGEAAIRYLVDTLHFDTSAIIICGRSIGTTAAINTAMDKKIAGVILITPMTSGKAMAKAMGLGFLGFIAGHSFDNQSKSRKITARALVIHGTADEVVPYDMGTAVFAALGGPKTMMTINRGRHNDLELTDSEQYWNAIDAFVAGNMPQAGDGTGQ